MTKEEKKQFSEAWQEAENIITLIDPYFEPKKQLKRSGRAGPEEIKSLLQFLRVLVRTTLHDKESVQRERDSFYNMLRKASEVDI